MTLAKIFTYMRDKKRVVRLSTITGRLSTLLGYFFTDKDIVQSFGYLLVDLFARNYPKKVYNCHADVRIYFSALLLLL